MSRETLPLREQGENIALHRFALFTACCTAFLIFVGGLVTITESGLAVPDSCLAQPGALVLGTSVGVRLPAWK
jgi:hypothetical protein